MITSPYLKNLLQAHHFQGKTNDCGPFSTAIVLRALQRTDLEGSILAKQMNAIRWRGILPILQRIPDWATFPWGIVQTLKKFGLRSYWTAFQTESTLIRALRQGMVPIIILGQWKPLWAHYLILVAQDDQQGLGFVDPAHPKPQIVWYQRADFNRLWKHYGQVIITVFP